MTYNYKIDEGVSIGAKFYAETVGRWSRIFRSCG